MSRCIVGFSFRLFFFGMVNVNVNVLIKRFFFIEVYMVRE